MAAVVPGEQVARQRTITQGSGYSGPGSSRGQEVGTRGHQGALLTLTLASRRTTPTPSCCSHRREPGRRNSPNTSRISRAKLCLSVSSVRTCLQHVTAPLSLLGISCAYVGDILLQGHLYVTDNYLAFHSNVFGYVTKVSSVPRDRAV